MDDHLQNIRAEFSRQADTMAKAALFNDQAVLGRIREAAALTPQSRVLDVACGPGIVVAALAPDAGEVVACDITPEMISKAELRCEAAGLTNVRCMLAHAEDLPFETNAFDVVVCRSAVHHFQNPAVCIREMARVLRDEGRVVIVDVISSEDRAESALHNALERLRDPSHVRMVSKNELQRDLQEAGLNVETCTQWTNHRDFDDWLRITNSPERADPLRVVMAELARRGAGAGIGLRLDGDTIRFEHSAVLIAAVKHK